MAASLGVQCMDKAKCEICPLRMKLQEEGEWRPVPAQIHPKATALAIGHAPSKIDADMGVPMISEFGAFIVDGLKKIGKTRQDLSWTYTVACKFPGGAIKADKIFYGWLQRTNRARKKKGEEPYPSPEECCAPRLEAEIALHESVLAFGSEALQAVGVDPALDANPTFEDFAGFPTYTANGKRLFVTYLSVLWEPKYKPLVRGTNGFRGHLRKAFQWFADDLPWKRAKSLIRPSPKKVRRFLKEVRAYGWSVVDVEAAPTRLQPADPLKPEGKQVLYYNANTDPMRCIGVYNPDTNVAMILPKIPANGSYFSKRDGTKWFDPYTEDEWAEIVVEMRAFGEDENCKKIGHNILSYDHPHFERAFGPLRGVIDTLPLIKLGLSEYRHNLRFLGAEFTNVGPWKAEHAATEATTDGELLPYNSTDLRVNWLAYNPTLKLARKVDQAHLYKKYEDLTEMCRGMHRLGLRVDLLRVAEHKERLELERSTALKIARETAGDPELNPASFVQLGELWYDQWDLPIRHYTDTGAPSTGKAAVIELLASPLTDATQKAHLEAIRTFKAADTLLNNNIVKWEHGSIYIEEDRKGAWCRIGGRKKPRYGWIYPDFMATGTVGWRFSSHDPNFQNIRQLYLTDRDANGRKINTVDPKTGAILGPRLASGCPAGIWNLRDCFVPPDDDSVFAYADMDALELRVGAVLAECQYYIDVFQKKEIDVHNLSMQLVFGSSIWQQPGAPKDPREKGDGAFGLTRDLIKRFVYGGWYGAEAPTILDVLREAEDDQGGLINLALNVHRIRKIRDAWLRAIPELPAWWKATMKEFRAQGYLEDPHWGLRRYFPNGGDQNDLNAFKGQTAGAAIVHEGVLPLALGTKKTGPAVLPFDFARKRGLCLQVHDAAWFIVDRKRAAEAKAALTEHMNVTTNWSPIQFTAKPKIIERVSG